MKKFLDNFEEIVGAALFIILFVTLLCQVLFRKIFNSPLTWSEEFSILMFVYIGLLGVSIGVKKKLHVYIDFLYNKFSDNVKRCVGYFINAVILVCLLAMIYIGYVVFMRKAGFNFITLKISLGYMYAALPLVSTLMLVRFIQGVRK